MINVEEGPSLALRKIRSAQNGLETENYLKRNANLQFNSKNSFNFEVNPKGDPKPSYIALGVSLESGIKRCGTSSLKEEFSMILSQVRSEHGSAPTPDDASNAEDDIRRTQCWVDIVGGKKKGRIYGAGQLTTNYTSSRGGTLKHQPSSSTTIAGKAVVRLTHALEQRDQEITGSVHYPSDPATTLPQQPTSVQLSSVQLTSVQPTPVQPSIEEQDDEDHSDGLFGWIRNTIVPEICLELTEGFTEGFSPSEISEGLWPSIITEGLCPSLDVLLLPCARDKSSNLFMLSLETRHAIIDAV
ncbi:hypothetical protein LR48_Vigan01g072800 [Vigna angularis]|uniref:Uncharacterized protein n=1 Tax=Phaseolus angularis TaxID=3914 RepID=A0A0L9TKQ6_PHAAN|nr:hypothetical protein LR48_Vigan01g072800 [Vigna angularis]